MSDTPPDTTRDRPRTTRKPEECIPIYRHGGQNVPERFFTRGLCTEAELPALMDGGWLRDYSRFAADPSRIPVEST